MLQRVRLRLMRIPEELQYTKEHEWVAATGSLVRVGITDYAQDALGDVVYVDLPEVGKSLAEGDILGEIESTKSVSEVYAPVAGTVVEVNGLLDEAPELVNSDPYGEGWLCVMEIGDAGGPEGLMDAAAYGAITNG